MTATIHPLPLAPLIRERQYSPGLLGRRIKHRHLAALGRCSGEISYDRGALWLEVDTRAGRYWWLARNTRELEPIAVPAPYGRAG